jgi:putative nucleotidyltransferase with HDIG domain
VPTATNTDSLADSLDSYLRLIRRSEGKRKCSIMDDLTLTTGAAKRLAEHITANRREIAASSLHSNGASRSGSIANSLFVNGLMDRLTLECESLDRRGLDSWVSEMSTHEPVIDYGSLVLVGLASVSASFVAAEGAVGEIVRYLALRSSHLERSVSQTRVNHLRDKLPDPAQVVAKEELVGSLLATLEARDGVTCEHSRAVGAWCERIAKGMGMNHEGVNFVTLAGTLHDIGKVTTPSEVLLKPGPLTNDEWETMRSHSERGAKILEQIPSLRELAPVVRAHHERFDGLGYPDRLEGNAIPLAARIVAVADAFHAMISKRPYREAMSVSQAINNLMDGRGRQWDPRVVDMMISVVKPIAKAPVKRISEVV